MVKESIAPIGSRHNSRRKQPKLLVSPNGSVVGGGSNEDLPLFKPQKNKILLNIDSKKESFKSTYV